MNLSEIQKEINKDIEDTIQPGDSLGWINRALDDLSPYAKHQKLHTINTESGIKKYSLPEDLIEITQLVDEDKGQLFNLLPMTDFTSYGYKLWGKELILQPIPKESKELNLYYYGRLPHLVNPDDVPEIPSQFHDLLVLYAVSRYMYSDEEESMQQNAMQEYFMRKDQFINFNQSYEVFEIQEVRW
jgi:hypothetical protein